MSVQVSPLGKTDLASSKAVSRDERIIGSTINAGKVVDTFKVIADATGGVARLRELVLNLAFSGRLTPPIGPPTDAAQLLVSRLVGAATSRSKRSGGSGRNEGASVPFVPVPSHWAQVPLGDIAILLVDGSHNPPKDIGAGGIPMLSGQNIRDGVITLDASRYMSEGDYEIESRRTPFQPGDVLLSIVGSIGRSAVVPDGFPRCGFQRSAAIIRTGLEPEYLSYYLRSPRARTYYAAHAKGTAQLGIYLGSLGRLDVPVPSSADQKRIVAKVDQLMTLCDDLEARQTKKREVRQRLTKSALLAIATAEGSKEFDVAWKRVVENFEDLVNRSEDVFELRSAILGAGLRGRFGNRQGPSRRDSDEPPQGWTRTTIGALAAFVTSGSRNWKTFYARSGATFVRSQDIKTDTLDLSSPAFVSVPPNSEGLRTRVEKDDLLITITGANVGKVAHVELDLAEAYVSQHVALVRLADRALASWLYRWLVSPTNGRGQLLGSSYGDKPGLNLQQVKDVVVDVPPVLERGTILSQISEMLARCSELEATYQRAEVRAAELVEAIVQELAPGAMGLRYDGDVGATPEARAPART